MNRIWKISSVVLCLVAMLVACSKAPSEIEVELLWSMDDIKHAEDLANNMGGILLSYSKELYIKPPFYEGEMPLKYVATGKQMGGGGMMSPSMGAAFVYDFGSWVNYFIYKDMNSTIRGMPDGAIAVDAKTKVLVGECKILEMLTKDNYLSGFKVVENHFNLQGEAIFSSVFEISFSDGFKTKELKTKGKKQAEYFFVWPNGMGSMF